MCVLNIFKLGLSSQMPGRTMNRSVSVYVSYVIEYVCSFCTYKVRCDDETTHAILRTVYIYVHIYMLPTNSNALYLCIKTYTQSNISHTEQNRCMHNMPYFKPIRILLAIIKSSYNG